MPIIITDEDAIRLLSIPEAIEAMRGRFSRSRRGPRRQSAATALQLATPDPQRRYFANIHAGAVQSLPRRLRARRLAFHAGGQQDAQRRASTIPSRSTGR